MYIYILRDLINFLLFPISRFIHYIDILIVENLYHYFKYLNLLYVPNVEIAV